MLNTNSPLTVAQLITASRQAKLMSLREFGETLGVSHSAVRQWQDGIAEPGEELLKSMLLDKREWVSQLAEDIYVARYRATLVALRAAVIVAA